MYSSYLLLMFSFLFQIGRERIVGSRLWISSRPFVKDVVL